MLTSEILTSGIAGEKNVDGKEFQRFFRRADSPMIAIVDDDHAAREATKTLVRSLGYQALTFASADEFLKSKQVRGISCLITDLHMPGLNGIELQHRLIDGGHRIPI